MHKDVGDAEASFPILGATYGAAYQGHVFVPIVSHPGVVHFVIKEAWTEQAIDVALKIREVWPLFVINILLIIIAGFCIWALVSHQVYVFFLMSLTL